MKFHIQANTADTMDDFLEFFEHRAFRDNPRWAGCYCLYPHYNDKEWEAANPKDNKMQAMVMLADGHLPGYLGYLNGSVIAWMAVGKRKQFKRFAEHLANDEDEAKKLYSITCITIDPDYRNQGIATAMLERVLADLTMQGVDLVEAYPMDQEGDNAHQHRGPLSLYLHAGFIVVEKVGIFCRVRKTL
ncbi:MAG: hypothetical protein A2Y20_00925 [Firmicutes bacterium GWF2_51_9]|nr:MAG: hypothetical protein A2Y20_00925 [Firmicutes bacterium GWF2_51_9]OGS58720.1 MAG: hypothetical protein A2Y19_04105 [Firmicutes bacterium GWE2_51_13]HAM63463.1 hypothetical protein [Erysipelotrichaceae bacterium]HAO61496.1 hypothetical protein [Erysipelotrichaceae bacterium]HBZ40488.1 hypothetical protein [Erysipelotrichaceae bacterium]